MTTWHRQPTTYRHTGSDFSASVEARGRRWEWHVYEFPSVPSTFAPFAAGIPGWHGEARTLRAAKKAAAAKINALAALGCQPSNAATALRQATAAGALRLVKRGVYTATGAAPHAPAR